MVLYFEFWTTGKLSSVAEARVRAVKNKTSKYVIEYRDGAGIALLARQVNDNPLMRTLNQHFLAHPLAKLEREFEAHVKKTELAAGQDPPTNGAPVAPNYGFLRATIPFIEQSPEATKPVAVPVDELKRKQNLG